MISILLISVVTILTSCTSDDNFNQEIYEIAEAKKTEVTQEAQKLLIAIGGIALFLSVLFTGFKMIFQSKNPKTRTESMSAITYILIGTIILSTLTLTTGMIIGYFDNMLQESPAIEETGTPTHDLDAEIEIDRGNFLTQALSALFSLIIAFFKFIKNIMFKENFSVIRMIFEEANMTHAPFTDKEWLFLNKLYVTTTAVVGMLTLLMVGKTGISYIIYSHSPQKREKLSNDIQRWILMGIFLAMTPILVTALTKLFNAIILMLYSGFAGEGYTMSIANNAGNTGLGSYWSGGATSYNKELLIDSILSDNFIENIMTSSVFTTKLAQMLYLYVEVKIIIIFMVRKIMLTVMYAFTPIAIAIWGISDRSYASAVWFGEIITNLSMGLFYAFVLFIMLGSLRASNSLSNWFSVIIWMMSIIPITKVLRNSLQGLFIMMAGVDEEALTGSAVGVLGTTVGATGAMMAGMGSAMMSTFKGRNTKDSQNIYNKGTGSTGTGSTMDSAPKENIGNNTVNTTIPVQGNAATQNAGEVPLGEAQPSNAPKRAANEIGNPLPRPSSGPSSGPSKGIDLNQYRTYDDYINDMVLQSKSDNQSQSNDVGSNNSNYDTGNNTTRVTRNPYSKRLTDKYQSMIHSSGYKKYNNVKDMAKVGARVGGAFVGNAAKMVFGHDPAFGYAVNNITSAGRSIGMVGQNMSGSVDARIAGRAIHETAGDIIEEEKITYKEAINKMFDQDSDDPYRMERVKVIGDLMNTREGVSPQRGKILYNTSPYTNIDNMSFKY